MQQAVSYFLKDSGTRGEGWFYIGLLDHKICPMLLKRVI